MDTRKNILEIKNMHTYFFTDNGVVKSVDGVDIELKEGSTLGIVGESGSGKSVTALSVMGLLMGTTGKVVEGQILLDGRDITNLSAEERRKIRGNQISMIFQEPMTSLKKEIGTSIMFITHDLGVVAETCDEVVVMYCGRVVEKGNVYDIFGKTAHPYTQGLLKSIPKLGEHVEELDSIPGNVPNPKYMPKGCKFAPRCAYATERCKEEEPGFFDLGNGHQSRCWLCDK